MELITALFFSVANVFSMSFNHEADLSFLSPGRNAQSTQNWRQTYIMANPINTVIKKGYILIGENKKLCKIIVSVQQINKIRQTNGVYYVYIEICSLKSMSEEQVKTIKTSSQSPKHTQFHEPFHQFHNMQLMQDLNNRTESSHFNCQWIDEEQSPYKVINNQFPSDIQIGLDGINVGSRHHIDMNHVQFNLQGDISLNNQSENQVHFGKERHDNELGDQSCISTDSNVRKQQGLVLGEQLQALDNSKEAEFNILDRSVRREQNLFDGQNNMISEIQPSLQNDYDFQQQHQNQTQSHIQNKEIQQNSASLNENSLVLKDEKSSHKDQNTKPTMNEQINKKQQTKSKSSIQKSVTITINENSFISKIYDDLSSIEQSRLLKSMINFLQTNQQTYAPFYRILEIIFTNSKIKSEKAIQNFYMYADFFKEKSKQLEKYVRQMQSQKTQKIFQSLKNKEIINKVYVDSKVVLKDIHQKNIKKVKLYKIFYKQISEMNAQSRKHITQIYQKRTSSQKVIAELLSKIKTLEKELEQLIEYRVNYQKHKQNPNFAIDFKDLFKVDNPHIFKDHYLQIKFIIEKESVYIKKLKQLRTQIIKYMTTIFLTDEILMSSKIKENLCNYTEMLIQVERLQKTTKQNNQIDSYLVSLQKKKDALLQKKVHNELKYELGRKLLQCIPQILKTELGISAQQKPSSQQLLQLINTHFQNEVFFTHIQIEDEFVFYKAEGSWISRDDYKVLESSKKMTSQKNIQTSSEVSQINPPLKFVLTINKYLHMQQNQKLATLKLNQIKISKKGQFIIISDRGKGIVGFLVNNGNQLGRIQLKSTEEADKFAAKIKQLVEQK